MIQEALQARFSWQLWRSEPADIARLNHDEAARILVMLETIRRFELRALELRKSQLIKGPLHGCVGQEANAVAVAAVLRRDDLTSGSHRAHHHFLAKLLMSVLVTGEDPIGPRARSSVLGVLEKTLAEILGLTPGQCGGRGGSMHLRDAQAGFFGSNAIVAGGVPLATGAAFACRHMKSDRVVVSFCGDGAVDQGAFHEACNLSGIWKLPIVHFVENNLYAEVTASETVTPVRDLSLRAVAYNMRGFMVDGSDVVGLFLLAKHVVETLRAGASPCIIESKCYRRYHHEGMHRGSEFGYRSTAEESEWDEKDPLVRFPEQAVAAGIIEQSYVERARAVAAELVDRATDFCLIPGELPHIRAALWPKEETLCVGLRSDQSELADVPFAEAEDFPRRETRSMAGAIGGVIGRWLTRDHRAVFIGEGVADYWSILSRAPEDVRAAIPKERIFNTPIAEAGFCGLAGGAAACGLRPIVEIMYPDFTLVAADQLFNQIGKIRHLYGNTAEMPVVVRTKVAMGYGYGGQHSMDPVGLFSLFPGWRIVVPSCAADYVGLFNTAMHSRDPVLIVEYLSLYEREFEVPADEWDYCVPFGKARVVCEGTSLTLVTYGAATRLCLAMTEEFRAHGVSAEIIDLRSLDTASLDIGTLVRSANRTGRVLIAEECAAGQGIGPQLAHRLDSELFGRLSAPILCVSAAGVPVPSSPALEAAALLNKRRVLAAALQCCHRPADSTRLAVLGR